MKLPEKIKGRNRIRDGAIVLLFKRDDIDFPSLAEKFNLTERRIMQILATNHAFVKRDKEWEKEKRINVLKRLLEKHPSLIAKKSTIDILEQIRKEIDGDEIKHSGLPPAQVNISHKTVIFKGINEPEPTKRDFRNIYAVEGESGDKCEEKIQNP
jgi:hypothetical protein